MGIGKGSSGIGGHSVSRGSNSAQSGRLGKGKTGLISPFSNGIIPFGDPGAVFYVHQGVKVIAFEYEYLLKMAREAQECFPKLPAAKPEKFDLMEFLENARKKIEKNLGGELSLEKLTASQKEEEPTNEELAIKLIGDFLDKTRLSKYVGGAYEFVQKGLVPSTYPK